MYFYILNLFAINENVSFGMMISEAEGEDSLWIAGCGVGCQFFAVIAANRSAKKFGHVDLVEKKIARISATCLEIFMKHGFKNVFFTTNWSEN